MPRRYDDDDDFDSMGLRRDVRGDVSTMVMVPAIILLVLSVLSLLGLACLFLFFVVMLVIEPPRNRADDIIGVTFAFGGTAVMLLLKVLIAGGAVQMVRMRTYPIALGAAVLQMVALCSPCWVIEMPIGIWAFVVLLMPDVRDAFYAEDA